MSITLNNLSNYKNNDNKMAVIALYDAAMAYWAQEKKADAILIGDSLGMTQQGFDSTLPVTVDQIIYHTQAVCRSNQYSFIIADMPFMSYSTCEQTLLNAGKLLQSGAKMVKLEGGQWLCEHIQLLSERGIPTCAHLGLTPQSVNKLGAIVCKGEVKTVPKPFYLMQKHWKPLAPIALVLECIPETLARMITEAVNIPTIGIGAGNSTDGQVLVINDLLGITPNLPKFAHNFLTENTSIPDAIAAYIDAVKAGEFPTQQHSFQ